MNFLKQDWNLLRSLARRIFRYELDAIVTGSGSQIGCLPGDDDHPAVYVTPFKARVYHGWLISRRVPIRYERRAIRKAQKTMGTSPVKSNLRLQVKLYDPHHKEVFTCDLIW